MPSEMQTKHSLFSNSPKWGIALIGLLVLVAVAWVIRPDWKNLFSGSGPAAELPPVSVQSASPTVTVPTTSIAPAAVATLTPVSIVTETPISPAGSALPTHDYEVLKMPLGSSQGYLVHIVAVGENLDKIAEHYQTTVPAILAVNYKLKPPVWAQHPLVIPVGAQDATGLPAFKVHVVEVDTTVSAEALAETLGVDAGTLAFYNLCTGNCEFNTGDVLLVPYFDIE